MTKQEPTIDLLKSYIRKCEESLESTTDYALLGALVRRIELLRYAIECIEKQIPKKPTTKEFNDSPKGTIETIAYCPNCGYSQGEIKPSVCYSIRMQKYIKYGSKYEKDSRNIGCCIACGQAIDWSDNE